MVDSPAMSELRLRFCNASQPDLVLGTGVHALGRTADGLEPVGDDAPWLLQLCNDRRGIWLAVADGGGGVHVNGRPVHHVAMLRAGDSIHVDGAELLLASEVPTPPRAADAGAPREPVARLRYVLRGVGGSHHGRSISLEKTRRIGRAADADIQIDGPGIAERHAEVELAGHEITLRAGEHGVMVNGLRVRESRLVAGDQIAFDVQHRFVVEGPPLPLPATAASARAQGAFEDDLDAAPVPPRQGWTRRVPWLLLAAILLAAALSALLLFGAR